MGTNSSITIKEQLSNKDIELLAISMRPCHLPKELFHVTAVIVYCTSQLVANGDMACDVLRSAVSRLQTQHPSAQLISGGYSWRGWRRNNTGSRQRITWSSLTCTQYWGWFLLNFFYQPSDHLKKLEQVWQDHQLWTTCPLQQGGLVQYCHCVNNYFIIHPSLSFPLNCGQYYLCLDLLIFVLLYLL